MPNASPSSIEMAPRRLRIALLVDRYGTRYGGAESYGVELARVLAQRHDVTIVAREFDNACEPRLARLPIPVSRHLPSWLRVLYFAWRAHRLTRGRFDIVHSHMNGWAGHVQVLHVVPERYKYWIRARLPKRIANLLAPRTLAYMLLERARLRPAAGRRAVAVSGMIAAQSREAYGARRPGLDPDIIAPGVHAPAPPDPQLRLATRRKLGWTDATIGCALVARNPLRKGLRALADALALLPADYRLVVVGADLAAHTAMQSLGELGARIALVPPTPDVSRYLYAADIYTHPTLRDSFGMGALEAMAHGLPVVVSGLPYCGFAQYLEEGADALVLRDPRDGAALADALRRLGDDAGLRERLRRRGQTLAARHSWDAVAQRYEALYAAVLEETRGAPAVGNHTTTQAPTPSGPASMATSPCSPATTSFTIDNPSPEPVSPPSR
jgi:UDP-glucose:(heptosyl)LPS alpha-1,3-glucosyltransferase